MVSTGSKFSALYDVDDVKDQASLERLIHSSGFFSNLGALLTKRFHIYKRDRTGIICEVLVPCFMVLFGSCWTLVSWYN